MKSDPGSSLNVTATGDLERARYEQIVAATNVGTWSLDIRSGAIEINDRWAEMIGYSKSELHPLNAKHIKQLMHPDDAEHYEKALAEHCCGVTEQYQCEARLRHKNGHWVWLRASGKVLARDENGDPLVLGGCNLDISDQKRAEQTIRYNEQHIHEILDSLYAYVALLSPEGKFEWINRAPLIAYGVALEDVVGRYIWETDWFSYCPALSEKLQRACALVAQGEECRFNVVVRVGENRQATIDLLIFPLRDSTGRITHIVPTGIDVSERESAMKEMRDAKQLLEGLIENMPAMVYVKDAKELRYVSLNRAGEEILGRSRSELLGKNAYDFFPEEQAQEFEAHDRHALSIKGGTLPIDQPTTVGDENRYMRTSKVALRDSNGEATHLVGITLDVTELKAASELLQNDKLELEARVHERTAALEESEERFRTAMRDSSIGMALVQKSGEWIEVNDAMCEMFGYSADELKASRFQDITHPDDLDLDLEILDRLLRGEVDKYELEKRFIRKDNSVVWVKLNVSCATDKDGKPRYLIAQLQNISADKLREAATTAVSQELLNLSGDDYHVRAAIRLAEILESDIAFISEYTPNKQNELRTLALIESGLVLPQTRFTSGETPFTRVAGGAARVSDKQLHDAIIGSEFAAGRTIQSIAAEPIFDSRSNVVGYLGVIHSGLTAKNKALQQVLRIFALSAAAAMERARTLKRHHDFVEFAPDAMVMFKTDGVITMANRAAEELFGLPRSSLSGTVFDSLLESDSRRRANKLLRKAIGAVEPRMFQTTGIATRGNGAEFPIEISLRRIDGDHETLISAALRDLTERYEAEREMRQALAALDATVDAAFIFDELIGFTYVNKGAVRQLGYCKDELLRMSPYDIVAGSEKRIRRDLEAVRTAKGQMAQFETRHRRRDGKIVPVEVTLQYIELADQDARYIALARDISARLEQQADRDARKQAEEANAAKSAFLAAMSHEIRTPMNGVIGSIDLLTRSSLRPHQMELAETASESADSLLRIIDDVLDFSKIEAGRLELECEPVSVTNAAESVCAALNSVALKQNVALDLFTDPELPSWILSDSVRIRQILNNLVSNAIKFCGNGDRDGRVLVRIERSGNDSLLIAVSDNGIGMNEATQRNLFQPFVQAEASTTRRFGGSGLGLSICRRLVDVLGGEIHCESAPDKGSTFVVELPFELAPVADVTTAALDLHGLHCIILTSDARHARDWGIYFDAAGTRVSTAANFNDVERAIEDEEMEAVVVADGEIFNIGAARLALERLPGAAIVLVDRGQRQRPRELQERLVQLDGNACGRERFLLAACIATGRVEAQREFIEDEDSTVIAPDRAQAIAAGQLILVAEDNEVNRKVIRHQLALLGFSADVVEDGRAALNAWREQHYGVVLTDLHMPELDGYGLTKAIRSEEAPGVHTPIIALTANALKGEESRCLKCGMDDYLTKPTSLEQLQATVNAQFAPPQAVPTDFESSLVSGVTEPAQPLLDLTVLVELVGGDEALVDELLAEFRLSVEQTAGEMADAVAKRDGASLVSLAHRLKSSARSVGALSLGACCEALESHGSDAPFEALSCAYDEFTSIRRSVCETIDNQRRSRLVLHG